MAKSTKYDWESVWIDYRAGVVSAREVARKHGVDHSYMLRKADKLGIKRDLTELVKKAVENKLVTTSVPGDNASDKEIIDTESDKVVQVITLHRKDILSLRELEAGLIKELSGNPKKTYVTQFQGAVITHELSLTVSERSQAANNLANVQHKRIQLERQAYNLKDGDGVKKDAEDFGFEITVRPKE